MNEYTCLKMTDDMKIIGKERKGHWEIEFEDGNAGLAIYDQSLTSVMMILVKSFEVYPRTVSEIKWVQE